jgi:hypothetical protein
MVAPESSRDNTGVMAFFWLVAADKGDSQQSRPTSTSKRRDLFLISPTFCDPLPKLLVMKVFRKAEKMNVFNYNMLLKSSSV